MTITSILLLFHSSIAHINPFSGFSHYLEANQVIYDADRLTGLSVMGISIERSFRKMCKRIFFVNRIILLLPVYVFDIFHVILFQYSGLFHPILGLYSCFWPFFCWLERHLFSKTPVNLIRYRGTVRIFDSQHFVFYLKHKNQSLLIFSQSNIFSHYVCFFRNSFLLFLFLAVFLILKLNSCKRSNNSRVSPFLVAPIKTWLATWFYSLLLLLSGDVELNPGPKRNSSNTFLIYHWNLNSISADNYAKVFLFKAYIAIHKFDIICISETYLDSSTPSDDNNLEISGYTLVRSDHPSNNRGSVCIYYKSSLPLRILIVQYLQESICFELKIRGKTCNFLPLYRSPSQSQNDFETFTENFELNLENLVQRNPF